MESFRNTIKKIKAGKKPLGGDINCLLNFMGIFLSKGSGKNGAVLIPDKITTLQNTWFENCEPSTKKYHYATVFITIISKNGDANKQFLVIKARTTYIHEQYFIICDKNNIDILVSDYKYDSYHDLKSKNMLYKPGNNHFILSFQNNITEIISKATKFGTFFVLKTELKNTWTILKLVLRNLEVCIFNKKAFDDVFNKFFIDTIKQNEYIKLLDYF